MPEKRKDNKGRILREGEVQRSDGKYMYRYTDAGGIRRAIYSWRLVESDRAPDGKRSTEPLRTQIKRIQRDMDDGISSYTAYKMTLNSFYDAYTRLSTSSRRLQEPTTSICTRNMFVMR